MTSFLGSGLVATFETHDLGLGGGLVLVVLVQLEGVDVGHLRRWRCGSPGFEQFLQR